MESALFDQIGELISGKKRSNMFGVPAFKLGRKPFILFYENELVCKLFDESHAEAMALSGTSLFSPMGEDKPMVNWVQIPYAHSAQWEYFAQLALAFVETGR